MDTKSLAQTTKTNYLNPIVWEQMKGMAGTFIQSGALPKNLVNVAQVVVVLQAGSELGMKPMEAINSLYLVNGSVNVWGKATTKLVRKHGWQIGYNEPDANTCVATIKKDGEEYTETSTFEDAEKSGFTKDGKGFLKFSWKLGNNRKLKLRYMALSNLIKTYIPEVMDGVGDIQEIAEDYVIPEDKVVNVDQVTPEQQQQNVNDFIAKAKAKKANIQDAVIIEPKIIQPIVEAKKTEAEIENEELNQLDQQVQARRLTGKYFAIAKEQGVDAQEAKRLAKETYKLESFANLTVDQLQELINKTENESNI